MNDDARRALPGLAYPEEQLKRSALALHERFAGVFSTETIERCVLESYTALLRTSKVKAHLSNNAIRFATERLTALAQAQGALPRTVPEVLFVCEQNAGRSQMAAALLHELAGGRVHVRSAGSAPANELHDTVLEAMSEIDISLEQQFPKPLTDDVVQAADVVITMGCGDACPVYPGKRYQDWELEDPANQSLEVVRAVREEIRARVLRLIDELAPAA